MFALLTAVQAGPGLVQRLVVSNWCLEEKPTQDARLLDLGLDLSPVLCIVWGEPQQHQRQEVPARTEIRISDAKTAPDVRVPSCQTYSTRDLRRWILIGLG